jgi:hypothetical protein
MILVRHYEAPHDLVWGNLEKACRSGHRMSMFVRHGLRGAGARTVSSCDDQSVSTDKHIADAHADPHSDGDEQGSRRNLLSRGHLQNQRCHRGPFHGCRCQALRLSGCQAKAAVLRDGYHEAIDKLISKDVHWPDAVQTDVAAFVDGLYAEDLSPVSALASETTASDFVAAYNRWLSPNAPQTAHVASQKIRVKLGLSSDALVTCSASGTTTSGS